MDGKARKGPLRWGLNRALFRVHVAQPSWLADMQQSTRPISRFIGRGRLNVLPVTSLRTK